MLKLKLKIKWYFWGSCTRILCSNESIPYVLLAICPEIANGNKNLK